MIMSSSEGLISFRLLVVVVLLELLESFLLVVEEVVLGLAAFVFVSRL